MAYLLPSHNFVLTINIMLCRLVNTDTNCYTIKHLHCGVLVVLNRPDLTRLEQTSGLSSSELHCLKLSYENPIIFMFMKKQKCTASH